MGAAEAVHQEFEEKLLGRLFFAFPGGLPGIALLLLRAVFGIALLLEGGSYIADPNSTLSVWIVGLSALVAGCLLLIGFLTPIVATMVAVGAFGVALSLLPHCALNLFDSKSALVFGLTMLLTLVGLGPGRFSVDARVFGRREIIIPPPVSGESR